MTVLFCLYCSGTGCAWCSETGEFEFCNPELSHDQLRREDEEVGRIRAWLYSGDELVHRLEGQGLTLQKISELRADLEISRKVSCDIVAETVSKVICLGIDFARLVDIRQGIPAPSELARELLAKAKHLRVSAEIVKDAESGSIFLPNELMPEVGYWSTTKGDVDTPHPKLIAEKITEERLSIRILHAANNLERQAIFMKSLKHKTILSRNMADYVYALVGLKLRVTGEVWSTLKIGGHEHKLSPLLSFLRLATHMIPKTNSGRTIEGLSAANLRRYAVEAQSFGAATAEFRE